MACGFGQRQLLLLSVELIAAVLDWIGPWQELLATAPAGGPVRCEAVHDVTAADLQATQGGTQLSDPAVQSPERISYRAPVGRITTSTLVGWGPERNDTAPGCRPDYAGSAMTAAAPRWSRRTTLGRTYQIRTHGCQMNVHDSERLAGLLESAGYVKRPTR